MLEELGEPTSTHKANHHHAPGRTKHICFDELVAFFMIWAVQADSTSLCEVSNSVSCLSQNCLLQYAEGLAAQRQYYTVLWLLPCGATEHHQPSCLASPNVSCYAAAAAQLLDGFQQIRQAVVAALERHKVAAAAMQAELSGLSDTTQLLMLLMSKSVRLTK